MVGELVPGLIRLGTSTSYHFEESMEVYVDDWIGFKLFLALAIEKGFPPNRPIRTDPPTDPWKKPTDPTDPKRKIYL